MSYTIPQEAIDQFRDAAKRFLFEEDGTLRANAFGPFPEFCLEPNMKAKIETQLGTSIETASQDEVVDAVQTLAINDIKFFDVFQSHMSQRRANNIDMNVEATFYDAFNTYHESIRRVTRDRDVDARAIGASEVAGDIDPSWPTNPLPAQMTPEVAKVLSAQLEGHAAQIGHGARLARAAQPEAGDGVQRGGGRMTDARDPGARRIIPREED